MRGLGGAGGAVQRSRHPRGAVTASVTLASQGRYASLLDWLRDRNLARQQGRGNANARLVHVKAGDQWEVSDETDRANRPTVRAGGSGCRVRFGQAPGRPWRFEALDGRERRSEERRVGKEG